MRSDDNNLRMRLKEALDNLWSRIKSIFDGLDDRVSALEEGGGGGGGEENVIEAISFNGANVPPDGNKRVSMNESDPTVPSWAKQSSKPSYTAAEVGALPDTTPIPSKTSDLTNDSGFLTSSTGVSGVKGDAESSYRQGNVNLTAANVGAVDKSGDTMTGNLQLRGSSADTAVIAKHDTTGVDVWLDNAISGRHGIWSSGYYSNSSFVSDGKWIAYRDIGGNIILNGIASALAKPQESTPWKNAPIGLNAYYYEGSNMATTYDLPWNNMFVVVLRRSQNRGIAFGFPWDVSASTKLYYRRIYDSQNADSWHSVTLS